MTMRDKVLGVALLLAGLVMPATAHHSFEVEYDIKKVVESEGVIARVEWTNPHMRIYIDAPDEKGVVTRWNLELGSPNSIVRRGWSRDDLKVGDRVKFRAYGGREVMTRAVADAITLADGRAFTGASGAPGR